MRNFEPKSKEFAERQITRLHDDFGGGLSIDKPRSTVPANGLTLLENYVNKGDRLEARGGTMLWADTALPTSDTPHGNYYHKSQKKVVLHIGTRIYVASAYIAAWTRAYQCGNAASLSDTWSVMDEYESGVWIFCNGTIFKLDLSQTPYVFYPVNTALITRKTSSVAESDALTFGRRTVVTMARLDGAPYQSRLDSGVAIEQETGSTQFDDGDYGEIFTAYAVGKSAGTYERMLGITIESPYNGAAGWTSITDGSFRVSVSGALNQDIAGINLATAASMEHVVELINTRIRLNTDSDMAYMAMEWDEVNSRFILSNRKSGGLFAGVAHLEDAASGTAIAELLGMSSGSGVTVKAIDYPSTVNVGDLVRPANSDHLTHYVPHATLDIGQNGTDPVSAALNKDWQYFYGADVPVAQALRVARDGKKMVCTYGRGKFSWYDVGSKIKLADGLTVTVAKYIGEQYAETTEDCPETLIGAATTTPYDVVGGWTGITDGEFSIEIAGSAEDIIGLDFSGCASMAAVAGVIRSALQLAYGSAATCSWVTDHFVITNLVNDSNVTVMSTYGGGAGTDISAISGLSTGAGATIDDSALVQSAAIGGGAVLTASKTGTAGAVTAGRSLTAADIGKRWWWSEGGYSVIIAVPSTTSFTTADSTNRSSQAATIDPVSRKYNDVITDDILRARKKSWPLRTRFWEPLPACDMGVLAGGIIWVAQEEGDTISYSALSKYFEEIGGYYRPADQMIRLKDAIQALCEIGQQLDIKCANSTHAVYFNTIADMQDQETGEAYVLAGSLVEVDGLIGCKARWSIDRMGPRQILVCSDHSLRIFDGSQYSADFAEERISSELRMMDPAKIVGSYDPFNGYILQAYQQGA